MSENIFPQAQQVWSFWEKAAKDNAAVFEAAVDSSVVLTKASLNYAAQATDQWAKFATEAARRFSAPKSA